MEIQEVKSDVISAVAKQVFGSHSVIDSIAEIRPTSEHGIPRISGCNKHLSYVVRLAGEPRRYVFRFSRGYRENLFEKEVGNYKLIADRTSVPTPKIYTVDRTTITAPTPYMVMEWMPGDVWTFLTHAQNPGTNKVEKEKISWKAGLAYSQIHNIERPALNARATNEKLLYRIDQLRHVVQDHQFDIDMSKLDACRQIIENDDSLLLQTESLCVNDAELHFLKTDGAWNPSFICDMEWVDFGEPGLELAKLCMPKEFWELDSLFVLKDAQSVSGRPFFKGYETKRHINYDKLSRFAPYAHLDYMCAITDQVYRPAKKDFMKSLQPKYVTLVDGILEMGRR
ncbi:MAG: phosphotransferase [Planctomycetota bacterium]